MDVEIPDFCMGCKYKFQCAIVESEDPSYAHGCPCSLCIIKTTCTSICDERLRLRQDAIRYIGELLTDGKGVSFTSNNIDLANRILLKHTLEKMEAESDVWNIEKSV